MRIERAEIAVKVDLSGTPDYYANVEHHQARRFRPAFAMVSSTDDVMVFGHRVNQYGIINDRRSTLDFPAQRGDVPNFVAQARKLAQDFRAEAENAWECRDYRPA